jgi:lipopolysaccharide/colanic/teichoic acid biosynthesis glycosyltransferase
MVNERSFVGTANRGLPRWFDLLAALICLIVSGPLLLLLAVLIALNSPGSVLFRQVRIGLHGRTFTLYKLRTMRVSNQPFKLATTNDDRITPLGRILRRMKFDELPQLWNVLKGDMSLVGPRPEVPQFVNLENQNWQQVLSTKPGITDPLSLMLVGEEKLLSEHQDECERFYLETLQPYKLKGYLQYLRQRTWQSDLKVLLNTAAVLFFRSRKPAPTADELSALSPR